MGGLLNINEKFNKNLKFFSIIKHNVLNKKQLQAKTGPVAI